GDEKQITGRPADDIPNELDKFREEIKEYIEQDEDVLSYALFGQVATKFFKFRQAGKYGLDAELADAKDKVHPM
ncbi:MAG: oxaloacetate decarboxylase subunit alpha, partial [Oscillospiraceae bacterium]|nr:oxaloacetate decarboxylase subunit alpha [Oscillospiraceae bacterium]